MSENDTELNNFIDQFKSECISFQENEMGRGLELSFVQCAYNRLDHSEIGDLNTVFIQGTLGNTKVKILGYRYDDDDHTLVLASSIFDFFKRDKKLISTDLFTYANRVRTFFKVAKSDQNNKIIDNLNIDISTPEYDAVDLIKNLQVDRLVILLFTDYTLGERFKLKLIDPVDDIPVTLELCDLNRLFDLENSKGAREPLTYSFSKNPLTINLASTGDGFKSYIGSIPAITLAEMYKEHGARLLEGNVRSFLSSTTAVNKQIRNSIKNNPEKFFILNNGIAVTARNLKFDDNKKLIEATDFQIINGGQTTATLSKAVYVEKVDVTKASVAIKLTEISETLPQDEADKLVVDISKASNSQNKISDADFFSNHPFHIEMEKKSQKIQAPAINSVYGTYWYYERSKGAYKQKLMFSSKSEQKNFESRNPKKQVIKKEDLARVWLCWKNNPEPNIVSKGAASLFNKFSKIVGEAWEKRDTQGTFTDDYYKNTVSLIILLRDLKNQIKKEEWYDGGYLANIATYSISIFAEHVILELGNLDKFNLNVIWREQKVPEDLLTIMLSVAQKVTEIITHPEKGYANVTQWCKQERCWQNLKTQFEGDKILSDISERFILSNEEQKEQQKQRKVEAKLDKGINSDVEAVQFKHWKVAYEFDKNNKILGGKWQQALYALGVQFNFSSHNCKLALEALKKLREEGFEY